MTSSCRGVFDVDTAIFFRLRAQAVQKWRSFIFPCFVLMSYRKKAEEKTGKNLHFTY
jgi:hypothetical protein